MMSRGKYRAVYIILALSLFLVPVQGAAGQVREGATMTVLRGEVAVIRPDGTATQPAPSGTTVFPGDEIRTLSPGGALITFFGGTEIEMGPATILIVNRVSQDGARIEVSLKQVFGATISRVQALTDPASSYRIEVGGAVALVRGSTLAVRGPETTPSGVFASVACQDCGPRSSLEDLRSGERVPLGPPPSGYSWPVATGGGQEAVKDGSFEPFRVEVAAGLENTVAEAITTAEQQERGDTRGVPAGQVAAGQRQETRAQLERQEQDEDEDKDNVRPTDVTGQPVSLVGAFAVVSCTGIGPNEAGILQSRCNASAFDPEARVGAAAVFIHQTDAGIQTHTCPIGPNRRVSCTYTRLGSPFTGAFFEHRIPLDSGRTRVYRGTVVCTTGPTGLSCSGNATRTTE